MKVKHQPASAPLPTLTMPKLEFKKPEVPTLQSVMQQLTPRSSFDASTFKAERAERMKHQPALNPQRLAVKSDAPTFKPNQLQAASTKKPGEVPLMLRAPVQEAPKLKVFTSFADAMRELAPVKKLLEKDAAAKKDELSTTLLANVGSTKTMSTEQKYAAYAELVKASGGTFDASPEARNIVAIRKPDLVTAGTMSNRKGFEGHVGVYDDAMAVVWKDKAGAMHVEEFIANTDPAEQFSKIDGADVNKDGVRDTGRLPQGFYEFGVSTRTHGKNHEVDNCFRPTKFVEVDRDMNHDGAFNDNTRTSAKNSILIHNGGGNVGTGSAGCQTVKSSDWERFWNAASGGSNSTKLGYTLSQIGEARLAAS